MTKLLTLFCCSFIISINTLSAQTTMEEYNYLTKGYKIQVESGLDMKNGYVLVDKTNSSLVWGADTRKGTLKALYRKKPNNLELAAYLLVYQLNNEPVVYYCIPNPRSSSEVIKKYIDALYDGDTKTNSAYKLQLISFCLSRSLKWD